MPVAQRVLSAEKQREVFYLAHDRMLLEDRDAPVAFAPADLQFRRGRLDKRRAHALLTLDNDPLRSICGEDLEEVATTTTATHLLQAREGAQIVRHNVDTPSGQEMIRRQAEEFDAQDCAVENA
ncbi:hypothetical protein LJ656_34455 [Paraburkholderia sp. MMS20-SJTR3]|uniref:Uncharacterized protein n=1 Tax=Paraburkholderia sejongensis TaxID=2886946 RepID=A0ABS8K669_9BURK|nr:hypothetical protein [Paraburkholderia sp. MMS20-SJTR3]MCC8397645.1 hypothetical protein [Paraburkholderia sp. MMS20-SJTR3]